MLHLNNYDSTYFKTVPSNRVHCEVRVSAQASQSGQNYIFIRNTMCKMQDYSTPLVTGLSKKFKLKRENFMKKEHLSDKYKAIGIVRVLLLSI